MNKKAKIIVSVSVAVAVISIAVLVLFVSGVFSGTEKSEADKWREEAKNSMRDSSPEEVYNYLCGVGEFYTETMDESDGIVWYKFKHVSNEGTKYFCRKATYSDGDSFYGCSVWGESFSGSALLNEEYLHEKGSKEDMETYAEFLDWCDEIGLTPEQIMSALDYYQSQVQ